MARSAAEGGRNCCDCCTINCPRCTAAPLATQSHCSATQRCRCPVSTGRAVPALLAHCSALRSYEGHKSHRSSCPQPPHLPHSQDAAPLTLYAVRCHRHTSGRQHLSPLLRSISQTTHTLPTPPLSGLLDLCIHELLSGAIVDPINVCTHQHGIVGRYGFTTDRTDTRHQPHSARKPNLERAQLHTRPTQRGVHAPPPHLATPQAVRRLNVLLSARHPCDASLVTAYVCWRHPTILHNTRDCHSEQLYRLAALTSGVAAVYVVSLSTPGVVG